MTATPKPRYWVACDEAGIRHYVERLVIPQEFSVATVVKSWTISKQEARKFTLHVARSVAQRNGGYIVQVTY